MKRKYPILFLAGLAIAMLASFFQHSPGYMDADYYWMGGLNLARGEGFNEQILWNYLDDPSGLPHPSHAYWMPLTSVLAAAGLLLNPAGGFDQAQWGFVLIAALVPPLTAALTMRLYADAPEPRRNRSAWLAGLLALLPGYYFGFLTTTDSFGLYMLLGAVFFLVLSSNIQIPFRKSFLLGLLAGLMHLTRADGLFWLFLAPAGDWQRNAKRAGGSAVGGYFLVMIGWLVRNQLAFGRPLAPGGARALWWTRYDELFAYPASLLTFEHWWDTGFAAIAAARASAAGQNLLSFLAVNGMIFLLPLMLIGMWQFREKAAVRMGVAGLVLIFALMSFAFPFAGARGGFFHAAASVQPLLWALVPAGLDSYVEWGVRRRDWRAAQARNVFGMGMLLIAFVVTAFLGWNRVIAPGLDGQGVSEYAAIESRLQSLGASADAVVMVNNPPGYFITGGRPAIVIPDGGLPAILAAANRYEAQYLVLGPAQGLPEIYGHPYVQEGLEFLGQVDALQIYAIRGAP